MRMEKVNNNQIKCYLNQNDLTARELSFSEIAYGNPKTQNLFHDMMVKASEEFGFDMQNVPIMIEVVPVSYDSIMLIITKVDDPSEIDTQFTELHPVSGGPIRKAETNPQVTKPVFPDLNAAPDTMDVSFAYCFDDLESVIAVSGELAKYRINESTLYKENNHYILLLKNFGSSKDLRILLAGILSEFGVVYKNNHVAFSYYEEHCETIIEKNAIATLLRL